MAAASAPDGASKGGTPGAKWREEYATQLEGRTVYVVGDNDAPGRAFARAEAAALHGRAEAVFLLDLRDAWPDAPDAGDISDMAAQKGDKAAAEAFRMVMTSAKEYEPEAAASPAGKSEGAGLALRSLADAEEREQEYLFVNYVPKGCVVLLGGDGGSGKSSLWVDFVASVTSGRPSIFDAAAACPFATAPEHGRAMFFSSEDSVEIVLRRKLRLAGARLENVLYADLKDPEFADVRFDSPALAAIVEETKPSLVVFDPLQSFLAPDVNLSARNQVRHCLAPLVALSERTGAVMLIILHTNKRLGASGRSRLSDSADLWDLSRAVFIAGRADKERTFYLSQEKLNGGPRSPTILYHMDENGIVAFDGTTFKRDEDFQTARRATTPALDGAREAIAELLSKRGEMPVGELDALAVQMGIAPRTVRRAKAALRDEGRLKLVNSGYGASKSFTAKLIL